MFPYIYCYDLITLELIKEKNLVFGLTQENSIEFWIQYIYLYILATDGLYSTLLAYFKQLCVSYEVNMCCIYYITSLFLKPYTMFYMTI